MGVGQPAITTLDIRAGRVRAGVIPGINEQLVSFVLLPQAIVTPPTPIPWVVASVGIGVSAHLQDMDTGMDMPYTVPKGYALTLLDDSWAFDQDSQVWLYFDSNLVACIGMEKANTTHYINEVSTPSTLLLDTTAASAHTVDLILVNSSATVVMNGGITVNGLLKAIGTPPFPTEKDTKCPFCSTINHVKVNVTVIICQKCGKTYYVFNMAGRR